MLSPGQGNLANNNEITIIIQMQYTNCRKVENLHECVLHAAATKVFKKMFSEICDGNKRYVNRTVCPHFNACSQTCADLSQDVECKSECVVKNGLGGCFCSQNTYLQQGECVPRSRCR